MSIESAANAAPVPSQDLSATESQAPEQTQTPEQEAPKKPDFLSPKFAALTRKEREVRQAQKALEEREKQIAEQAKKYAEWEEAQKNPQNDWKVKLKNNPFEALQEAGLTFEELVEMQINEQKPTPDMVLKRTTTELEKKFETKLEELQRKLQEKEEAELQKAEQQAKQEYERVANNFRKEIKGFIESNVDTYELIAANDAQETVWEVIEEHYKQTAEKGEPRIMSVEEAAKLVEAHLEEEASKILKLKKFQQTSKKQEASEPKESATLSNTLSSEVPNHGERKLSNEESLRQAAKLIRWNE